MKEGNELKALDHFVQARNLLFLVFQLLVKEGEEPIVRDGHLNKGLALER